MITARCSSCRRLIVWTTSPTGARLPLDARPVAVYHINEQSEPPNAERMGDPLQGKLYVSHFVTCPKAAAHSRGK